MLKRTRCSLTLNSDKFALAATFAIAAVRVVILLSKGSVDIGADWIFCILYAVLCYGLFQFLRPIADLATGKDYIRSWSRYGMERIYKSSPIKYTIDLGFSVIGLCFLFYMMFVIWK